MALFSKPPAKKPDPPRSDRRPAPGESARAPVSAREIANQAGRQGAGSGAAEPVTDYSGGASASVIEWSPAKSAIEVAGANPGLCSVLENAALMYASGQDQEARSLLEDGVQRDPDARVSSLAWLALFDLLQRGNDRPAFDRLSLQYVAQFESSPPSWEEGAQNAAAPKTVPGGGTIALTGVLTAASASQIEAVRRAVSRKVVSARLDLGSVTGFDDAGARLLAAALADARKHRLALTLQKPEKLKVALDAAVLQGREGGEGAWLLSLELLQFTHDPEPFEERAIDYAIAFELSPPSWEPPPAPPGEGLSEAGAGDDRSGGRIAADTQMLAWSGALSGTAAAQFASLAEFAQNRNVVPLDLSGVERIDFVCAGALHNAISRIEGQRKSVQVVGASPIIRALLLLIGISPRHLLKKAQ